MKKLLIMGVTVGVLLSGCDDVQTEKTDSPSPSKEQKVEKADGSNPSKSSGWRNQSQMSNVTLMCLDTSSHLSAVMRKV
jgi:nitrous oxide reductase accessory protein NosL